MPPRNTVPAPRQAYYPSSAGQEIAGKITTEADMANGISLTESQAAMYVASGKLSTSPPADELAAAAKLEKARFESQQKADKEQRDAADKAEAARVAQEAAASEEAEANATALADAQAAAKAQGEAQTKAAADAAKAASTTKPASTTK